MVHQINSSYKYSMVTHHGNIFPSVKSSISHTTKEQKVTKGKNIKNIQIEKSSSLYS